MVPMRIKMSDPIHKIVERWTGKQIGLKKKEWFCKNLILILEVIVLLSNATTSNHGRSGEFGVYETNSACHREFSIQYLLSVSVILVVVLRACDISIRGSD